MNRRSFLKRLAIAAAGVAAGASLLTDHVTAKVITGVARARINPAYVTAQYEMAWIFNPAVFNALNPWGQEATFTDRDELKAINMPNERCTAVYPPRCNKFHTDGTPIQIYPFEYIIC